MVVILMLYSLYLCISQSRLTPVTSIPQISMAVHNEVLILTVTVHCRLMEEGLLSIVIEKPTLFPLSDSTLL